MNKTLDNVLQSWCNALDMARWEGKGRYAWSPAKDIADYFKLIDLIEDEEWRRAFRLYQNMDTYAQEMIPTRIVSLLYSKVETQEYRSYQ